MESNYGTCIVIMGLRNVNKSPSNVNSGIGM